MTKESFENNGSEAVVLHEVAREWFGNSVSPRQWSDLWLNEGHAVFYQGQWAASKYGGGALTLFALQQQVGAATFERIERTWVREHANGLGSTEDYIATASRVADRDLGPFLRGWLYGTKLPPMPGHADWTPGSGR